MINSKKDLIKLKEQQLIPESQRLEILITTKGEERILVKRLADAHLNEGNYNRALNLFLKLLGEEPNNARLWNKLAVTFIRLEEFDLAVDMSRIAYRLVNK